MTDYQKRVAKKFLIHFGQFLAIMLFFVIISTIAFMLPILYSAIFVTILTSGVVGYYSYQWAKSDIEYEQRQEELLLERLKRQNII